MIPILYNYNIEYTTKHSVACYDVVINGISLTWLSSKLSKVYQIWWPNITVVASQSKECNFESCREQDFFIL